VWDKGGNETRGPACKAPENERNEGKKKKKKKKETELLVEPRRLAKELPSSCGSNG